MDRRDFNKGLLGTAIGLLVSSRRVFNAEPVKVLPKPRKLDVAAYRVAMWDEKREVFAAPRARAILVGQGYFTVFPEPIEMTRAISIPGLSLVSPENTILNAKLFHDGYVCDMVCTDVLHGSVTMNWNPHYGAGDIKSMVCWEHESRERGRLETQPQMTARVFGRERRFRTYRQGGDVLRQLGRPPLILPEDIDRLGLGDRTKRLFTPDGVFEGVFAEQEAISLGLIRPAVILS